MEGYTPFSNKKVYWHDDINEWQAVICNRTQRGDGNPKLNRHSTSLSEQLIYRWIQYNNIKVYNRYTIDKHEYDLYIPSLNLVIEHQSGLHAETSRQFADEYKQYHTNNLGLKLLEVCRIDSNYQRKEDINTITYQLEKNLSLPESLNIMIEKIRIWFFKNYNLTLSPLQPSTVVESWRYMYPITTSESLLQYPEISKQFLTNHPGNFGITPNMIKPNCQYRFYMTNAKNEIKPIQVARRTQKYKYESKYLK